MNIVYGVPASAWFQLPKDKLWDNDHRWIKDLFSVAEQYILLELKVKLGICIFNICRKREKEF